MAIFPFGFFKAGSASFVPITDVYTSGSGTRTIPAASLLVVEVYSKGGTGGTKSAPPAGGGGSGAYAKKIFTIAAGDIGKTITWNTNNSGSATLVGDAAATNVTAAALNIACTKGSTGTTTTGGAGGTASGGSTNSNGNAGGSSASGGKGGDCPGPSGGAGGAGNDPGADGISPGGGGGGGSIANGSGAGGNPRIVLTWS